MANIIYSVKLRGTDNSITTINYELDEPATLAFDQTKVTAMVGQISAALSALTTASIAEESIRLSMNEDSTLPSSADVFEEATVTVWLSEPSDAEKLYNIRIPAPVQSIFLATSGENRNVVDVTSAALGTYVNALAANTLVSDGETISVARAVDVKRGYRSTKAKNFRPK